MNLNTTKQQLFFDSARLSHAYIAPKDLSHTLAMAAVCGSVGQVPCMSCSHCDKSLRNIHPDITVVSKPADKREIIIDQIRELKKDSIIVPNDSKKKAYIIDNADIMNNNAQNALLRILEEPPSHAVFILNTDAPDGLLPTVRSRCIEINRKNDTGKAISEMEEVAEDFLEAISNGNVSIAAIMFSLERLDRVQFIDFLNAAREKACHEIYSAIDARSNSISEKIKLYSRLESVLLEAGEYLSVNVSVGHISAMICANMLNMSAD